MSETKDPGEQRPNGLDTPLVPDFEPPPAEYEKRTRETGRRDTERGSGGSRD
jgi:hypothetical protein